MPVSETIAIGFLFLLGAALYASVGHGGASSYLAVMGLFSFAPAVMKPTALALNILVAAVATLKFYRAGLFKWQLFWPFAIASIPAAFFGGTMILPARWYKILVGAVLLYSARDQLTSVRDGRAVPITIDREQVERIHRVRSVARRPVQVRASDAPGIAHQTDDLPPFHDVAHPDHRLAQMEIRSNHTATVVDVDHVAGEQEVIDEGDDSTVGCAHRLANRASEIAA